MPQLITYIEFFKKSLENAQNISTIFTQHRVTSSIVFYEENEESHWVNSTKMWSKFYQVPA